MLHGAEATVMASWAPSEGTCGVLHVQIQAMLRKMFPGKVCGDAIDPDEAVAAGAAVNAAAPRLPANLVISVADVLPTDLGIQVQDGSLVSAASRWQLIMAGASAHDALISRVCC